MITALCMSPAVDKVFYIDDFEPGKLYRAKDFIKSAGGKGVNAARVLAELGEEVACLGFVAGDAGKWLQEEVQNAGVMTDFICIEGETRTDINIIDNKKRNETELLEPGPVVHTSEVDKFLQIYNSYLPRTDVLVCSGGLPEGIPVDIYRRLIEAAKLHNIKVILDTSNEMLENGIKAGPYMIKPNLRELRKLTGLKLDNVCEIRSACREIINTGVEAVVASMGMNGALLVTEKECLSAPAGSFEPVNTIGSGDSMVAGLAAGIARGYELEQTFRLGMACAAVNAQSMKVGWTDKLLVEEFVRTIELIYL